MQVVAVFSTLTSGHCHVKPKSTISIRGNRMCMYTSESVFLCVCVCVYTKRINRHRDLGDKIWAQVKYLILSRVFNRKPLYFSAASAIYTISVFTICFIECSYFPFVIMSSFIFSELVVSFYF